MKSYLLPVLKRQEQQVVRVAELKKLGVLYHYDSFDEYGWARFSPKCNFSKAIRKLQESTDDVDLVILDNQNVSTHMLNSLANLKSLHEVSIRNSQILEDGFLLPQTKILDLVGTKMNWNALSKFPNIELLTIGANQLNGNVVEKLNSLPSLTQLNIESVVTLNKLNLHLFALQHVRSIRLTGRLMICDKEEMKKLHSRFNVRLK